MYKHEYPIFISIMLSIIVVVMTINDMMSPLRAIATFVFFITCPGLSFITLLSLKELFVKVALMVALSFGINALIAEEMLYLKIWLPVTVQLIIHLRRQ